MQVFGVAPRNSTDPDRAYLWQDDLFQHLPVVPQEFGPTLPYAFRCRTEFLTYAMNPISGTRYPYPSRKLKSQAQKFSVYTREVLWSRTVLREESTFDVLSH